MMTVFLNLKYLEKDFFPVGSLRDPISFAFSAEEVKGVFSICLWG